MAPSIEAILKEYEYDPDGVDRVSHRKTKPPLDIISPNPEWPRIFQGLSDRMKAALGDKAVTISHTGSTSVPGLPAKDIIDIDLTVPNGADEAAYIPQLEALGYQFILREPNWHGHRFLCTNEPQLVNLHVWSPDSPEAARHLLFRDWLRKSDEDRDAYAKIKVEAAKYTNENGGDMMAYTERKGVLISQILQRSFKDAGLI